MEDAIHFRYDMKEPAGRARGAARGNGMTPFRWVPGPASPPSAPLAIERPAEGRIPCPEGGVNQATAAKPPGIDAVEEHLVSLLSPASFEADQYRTLRSVLEHVHKGTGLRVVAVTSPGAGDGKTTTAINLAGALAQNSECRVLLVDADLRRSTLADHLGLGDADSPGLVEAILDPSVSLEDVVRRRPPFNLSVLPAGRPSPTPYETLKSPRLGELLAEARQRYDHIVLDTPPVVPVPDCRAIATWVDGFLLVVAAHTTPRKLVEESLSAMDPSKVLGFVFNNDDHPVSGYYGEYYVQRYSPRGNPGNWWDRAAKRLDPSARRERRISRAATRIAQGADR